MLNIVKSKEDNSLVISLAGRLDATTAPQLESELKEAFESITRLTFDMEKLDYISSAGLRVILSAKKRMNTQGDVRIVHVGKAIMEIFDVTGFSEILTIE